MADEIVPAPEVLGLDERQAFRRTALARLDEMGDGGGRLIVDLRETRSVDSAGLGTLLAIQRLAADRHVAVVLRGLAHDVRLLLMVTRLDGLFELDPPEGDAVV